MRYILAIFYNLWKLYIGFVFVTTLLFFYPILLVFLYVERLKPYAFKIHVFWSRILRIFCFYAIHVEGEDQRINRKDKEPFIICANHTSYLDIFLMYSLLPQHRFLFMGKSEILSYPLVKTFFKRLNIPVYRESRLMAAKSFMRAKNEMEKGWSIVIFPEGKIPAITPGIIPFKEGAFKLAQSAKVGILPLTFLNNYRLFSEPERVLDTAYPGLVKVKIHSFLSADYVSEKPSKELSQEVFERIKSPFES